MYNTSGDNEQIKVFSGLEKAVNYAKSTYYEDIEFKQDDCDENIWSYDDSEDSVEILKLEIE